MLTTALEVLLIVGGCLLLPFLGGMFESYYNRISNLGIISMFLGSIVSLVGFSSLCVSWYLLSSTWGLFTAFLVFSMAWTFFLFLSFSAYSIRLNK